MPYSDLGMKDNANDCWGHAFASLINAKAGKYIVDGKMILEDKGMKDKEVFGPERTKLGEPMDYVELANKYVPNTAIAKTTFRNMEFEKKSDFLAYIKKVIDPIRSIIYL